MEIQIPFWPLIILSSVLGVISYLTIGAIAWGLWFRFFVWRGFPYKSKYACDAGIPAIFAAAFWPISGVVILMIYGIKFIGISLRSVAKMSGGIE